MKSAQRTSLGEELGIRDVPDLGEAARVEAVANVSTRPDRHGALHDDDRAPGQIGRKLVDDRPHGTQVGVAGLRRRSPHRDVEEPRPGHRLLNVESEADALGVPFEHLVEAGLVDRDLARLEPLDPLGDDVADHDLVAEVGEARAGHEADVAGPEHADLGHAPRLLG